MNRVFSREIDLPAEVRRLLAEFLLDRRTGNVQLHIKAGRILKMKIEETVDIS